MRHIGWIAAVVALGAATGCGSQNAQVSTTPEDDLAGRTFLSVKASGPDLPAGLSGSSDLSLQFHDDGRLSANAGCNTAQGPVDLSEGTLKVAELGTTEKGCPGDRQKRDEWVASLLKGEPRWNYDDDRLTLRNGSTTVVLADREVVEPDRPLEGTTWALQNTVDGDVASSIAGADKARLTFKNGTVSGTTGCNSIRGKAKVSDGSIEFAQVIGTKMACSGATGKQERVMLAVLDGKVESEVDGDMLKLSHPSGKGLDLEAVRGR